MKRKKLGFTLIEVLIVVAIIAVLAAVSIPVFTSITKTARENTCAANRRSLKAVLAAEYLTNSGKIDTGVLYNAADKYPDTVCPEGGTITFEVGKDGTIMTSCSIHTVTWTQELVDKIFSTVKTAGIGDNVDSTSVDGIMRNKLIGELEKEGIDLNALGAVSWRYHIEAGGLVGSEPVFEWSTADITALKNGDIVPVIRYRLDSGIYSVWNATVQTGSDGINRIRVGGQYAEYSGSKALSMAEKAELSNLIPVYNSCAESMDFSRLP